MTRHPAPTSGDALGERLDDLFRRRSLAMVRVAHLLVGNLAAAEDVVQEAFARAYGRLVGPVGGPAEDPVDRQAVLGALRQLSPPQRSCVVLRYFLAYLHPLRLRLRSRSVRPVAGLRSPTEAEIAAELKISAGSVKTHTARGLAALAKLLGEEGEEP